MEIQLDGGFGLRTPGPTDRGRRVGRPDIVHVRQSSMVRVRKVVRLPAFDTWAGDGSGLRLKFRVVRLKFAFQPTAGAPVFRASRDP